MKVFSAIFLVLLMSQLVLHLIGSMPTSLFALKAAVIAQTLVFAIMIIHFIFLMLIINDYESIIESKTENKIKLRIPIFASGIIDIIFVLLSVYISAMLTGSTMFGLNNFIVSFFVFYPFLALIIKALFGRMYSNYKHDYLYETQSLNQ